MSYINMSTIVKKQIHVLIHPKSKSVVLLTPECRHLCIEVS